MINTYNYIVYGNNHFPMHFVIIHSELKDCISCFNNSRDAHNFLYSELEKNNLKHDYLLDVPENILMQYIFGKGLYTKLENKQLYIKGV